MIKSIASNQKLVRVIYILILIVTFFKIYSSIFDEKVSLVGDNASYYILGNAIANGDGYTNIQHLEKEAHYHYPPGYPLLIAGVSKLFSNDIVHIKMLNGALVLGAVLLLFFIVKRLTENDHIAFATSFLTLLNYHILGYSTIMMSEVPFLFFSMLCIWLFLKIDFSKSVFKNSTFYLMLICLTFSFYIRSVALALFVSIAFFLFLKKRWKYLYSLIGGFVLLYLPWMLRNSHSTGNTYVHQLFLKNPYKPELGSIGFLDICERVTLNVERYITKEIPSSLAYVKDITYTEASAPFIDWLLGVVIIGVVLFGIIRLSKFRILIASYMLAFFLLLMVWPHVWFGTRFLLPLIPLLIFLFIYGMVEFFKLLSIKFGSKCQQYLLPGFMIIIFSFWSFSYGKASISKLQTQAEGVYMNNYQNYFAIADWIQENTPENTVTSVRKEGLFYLYSKRNVTNYQKTPDSEAQIEYLKSKNVDYVVVAQLGYSSTGKYLVPAIDKYPNKFKVIKEFKNPNTYLMQFLPELGYWGTWENGKRNGLGAYVWEDGQKYEGYWKNDVRHGKGVLYFKNGEQLSGVWEKGRLHGEVIKRAKNGEIIEKSLYENNVKVKVINEAN